MILGGGQDASQVTTTAGAAGKFEAMFYHKILEDHLGGVKGHFGPLNALAVNPDGRRYSWTVLHPFDLRPRLMKLSHKFRSSVCFPGPPRSLHLKVCMNPEIRTVKGMDETEC